MLRKHSMGTCAGARDTGQYWMQHKASAWRGHVAKLQQMEVADAVWKMAMVAGAVRTESMARSLSQSSGLCRLDSSNTIQKPNLSSRRRFINTNLSHWHLAINGRDGTGQSPYSNSSRLRAPTLPPRLLEAAHRRR